MVNLNNDQIMQLYTLAGWEAPENPCSDDISKVLIEIEKKMAPVCSISQNRHKQTNANVLLVDDLELSLYQLSKLLTNCGYNACMARSVEEALDYYKKQSFKFVIVDLFLPDPEDGLNLIDSINKSEKTQKDDTKIIVISGAEDKKLINECFVKGANEFINKSPDWHKQLLKHIGNLEIQQHGAFSEIFTMVEDKENKIASITLSNLYKNDVIEMLKREIQILINTGFVNIILDFERVKTLDSTGLNVIVNTYKSCSDEGGILKLCGVNNAVSDALSYVFLNNLIPVFKDKEAALTDFNKKNPNF